MAEYELLVARRDLREAQAAFEQILCAALPRRPGKYTLGHSGDKIDGAVLHSNDTIWFCGRVLRSLPVPRYWNALGLVKDLRADRSNSITVEVNCPIAGSHATVGGMFARDRRGGYAVLHSGRIGGGKKGVGKSGFLASLQESPVSVSDPTRPKKSRSGLLLAQFDDAHLVRRIAWFVVEVARFKAATEDVGGLSTKELLARAKAAPSKPKRVLRERADFQRNSFVAEYAKRRAKGRCDLCRKRAPFELDGVPFLECHHIQPLAEGGEDSIANTVALCPNCHRRLHLSPVEADLEALRKRAVAR